MLHKIYGKAQCVNMNSKAIKSNIETDLKYLCNKVFKLPSCYNHPKWSFVLKHVRQKSCINLMSGIVSFLMQTFPHTNNYPFGINKLFLFLYFIRYTIQIILAYKIKFDQKGNYFYVVLLCHYIWNLK